MNISEKAKWISFEGGEGCGKTSIINVIKDVLEKAGRELIVTREPGGVPISEQIRDVILDVENIEMDYVTEAMLYAAARRQHLVERVIPALESGKWVLMDRYVDSSIVYQGYARELGMEKVKKINEFAVEGHLPDITIYIDLDPEIGLSRIDSGDREKNRLDMEAMSFHRKVREGYLKLAKNTDRIVVVDGNRSIKEVVSDVLKLI
ncbi:MAG: dTMP kinase [Clostridiales bacterium]|nr:MAG: dTMP kinase [Clostridiales bacterium]